MDCEFLLCPKTAARGSRMLMAMIEAAGRIGIGCYVGDHYRGKSKWLMTYGLGHPVRREWTNAHLKSGGRLIGWDLGYWDRDDAMRLTIDRDHPQHLLAFKDNSRFDRCGLTLRDDYDANGPVVLAALGKKQRQLLGYSGMRWEAQKLKEIRSAYPRKEIVFRSKRPEQLLGLRSRLGSIQDALKGAALIVCLHSNVAVDACFAGIPVVCNDGIGAALYGNDLLNPVHPDFESRLQFLRNVAWWQWKPIEAIEAWKHIISILT